MALVSFVAQPFCSCELDSGIRGHTHCGLGFARGTVSDQILPEGATRPTGQGHTLLFPILFVAQVPAH